VTLMNRRASPKNNPVRDRRARLTFHSSTDHLFSPAGVATFDAHFAGLGKLSKLRVNRKRAPRCRTVFLDRQMMRERIGSLEVWIA